MASPLFLLPVSRCGHCKRLAPIWNELAGLHLTGDVKIAEVDCTTSDRLCATDVKGYPTLIMYKNGVKVLTCANITGLVSIAS